MSTKVTHHLREAEEMSLSLMELPISKCVAVTLTVKENYRTAFEMTLTTETPEQEQILRALVDAFQVNKETLKILATV
jgi:ABC-type lipopolysaccharide export system ATPase subunit